MAIKKTTSVIELMEAAKDLGSVGNTLRNTGNPLKKQDDKTTRRQDDKTTRRQLLSDLIEKQYGILHYIYFNRPFKISGSKGIGALLKIPYGSVRSSFRSLVKKHYISKPYALNIETEKYSTCKVNYEKCIPLLGETKTINPQEKPTKHRFSQ